MSHLSSTSKAHIKSLFRHIKLAYCTTLPRRVLLILLLVILSIWGTVLWGYHRWSTQSRWHHHTQQTTDTNPI